MTSLGESLPLNAESEPSALERGASTRWERFESWLMRLSDRLNPILVKEARQALKSKQFTITFSLLLAAGWIWSILGLAIIGPAVYYVPAGADMFYGYYLILSFPLLVVVPFSAFRSLSAEREDRTYELLSITVLTPRQIVGGKLASAFLQMLVYLSAISPFLAFTYLLRGIDIISIGLFILYVVLASLAFSVLGLLAATSASEKYRQVILSVALIFGLGMSFFFTVAISYEMLEFGGLAREFGQDEFWVFHAAMLTAYASYFALVFLTAAAQLSFSSSNRSTPLRVVMLIQQILLVSWMGGLMVHFGFDEEPLIALAAMSGIHWWVMGAFVTGESSELSPRVKRDLPQTFLGRALLTWFNPGPGTGYMFVVANMLSVVILLAIGLAFVDYLVVAPPPGFGPGFGPRGRLTSLQAVQVFSFATLMWAYMTVYLGLGRWLISQAQKVSPVGPFGRVAIHVLLLVCGTGIPMVIQMMSSQMRFMGYTMLQISNPFWTLVHIVDTSVLPPETGMLMIMMPLAAVLVFVANLPGIAAEVRQVRISKPTRVEEEDAERLAQLAPPEPVPASPFD